MILSEVRWELEWVNGKEGAKEKSTVRALLHPHRQFAEVSGGRGT